MDPYMMTLIYVEGLTLVLSAALAFLYAQNYRAIPSKAGMGLLLFALLFLVQNAVGVYLHVTTGEFYANMLAVHAFFLELIEAVALIALLYTAWTD